MKIKAEFSAVLEAVEQAKRQKVQEVLQLPKSQEAGIAAVIAKESTLYHVRNLEGPSNLPKTINLQFFL